MFKINDVVNYSTTGLCNIVSVEKREVAGSQKEFFVLKPIIDDKATVMVPTDNELLISRMYNPLSKNEADLFVAGLPDILPFWVEDDRLRNEEYKKVLISGERERIAAVIKALYIHQSHQSQKGRKLRSMDERFLRDAERLLCGELSYVLGKESKEISQLVLNSIKE
ncbi:MAG: hypothetical protein IJE01_02185 [Clostridia bacterium]|nr:hypothetical protein [Clostridia bacterium]